MLDDFKFLKSIGRGAFGDVYLYERRSNHQEVVIKKIAFESSGITLDECRTAENEVKVLAMLHHPNILEYYESSIENNSLFIVMEYAPGGTLFGYLQSKEKKLLQEEDVLHLFCQLASGIQHIHDQQILHRDLKSHNVMLDRSQRTVKIGDFGISKILESKSKADTIVGTPCYLSPEQCREKPYNQKSDVWALGCILYEMLTLQRAFEAETLPALINKIMRGRTLPISDKYSAAMVSLVQSMLNVDPNARPSVNQIISNPLVFPTLMRFFCDHGSVRIAAASNH